jgi:glycerol-3-phosphate dehydrogenase (NAD(P)+)
MPPFTFIFLSFALENFKTKNTTKKLLINKQIGVLGAGSFGTAVSNLIALNSKVVLYTRSDTTYQQITNTRSFNGIPIHENVEVTLDLNYLAKSCDLIFPIVPSRNFRKAIRELAPYLTPQHILIHGTKGFDIVGEDENESLEKLAITRENLKTMSEVILEETNVLRIGCLSGPNLASEIIAGQPTAAVVASRFKEVVTLGKSALNSKLFHVFGSNEILGAELAGALKNIVAIGSGMLSGLGLGKNIQAMLITRGLTEMIYFGKAMGVTSAPFLGTAGIGDLVATATSKDSRNFTFGYRLAKGESKNEIIESMSEVAEGVRTLRIARQLAKYYKLHVPITMTLYACVYDGFDLKKALDYLIQYPYDIDVDFI